VTWLSIRTTCTTASEILPNIRYRAIAAPEAGALEHWDLARPRYTVAVGLRDGRSLPALSVGAERDGEHFVMVAGRPVRDRRPLRAGIPWCEGCSGRAGEARGDAAGCGAQLH
jgi:hypothetical protein